MKTVCAAAAICFFLLQILDERVVTEQRWPSVITRTIVISPDLSLVPYLEKTYDELRLDSARVRMVRIEVFPDADGRWNDNCKCRSDVSYEAWSRLYGGLGNRIPVSGELLILNGNAAVRTRDKHGAITSKVLGGGADPFSFRAEGRVVDVLNIVARRLSPLERHTGSGSGLREYLGFYVLSREGVDESLARSVTSSLYAATGVEDVEVYLRTDPWFITDEDFPIVPTYISVASPPTESQYQSAPEWRCTASRDAISCHSKPKAGGMRRF